MPSILLVFFLLILYGPTMGQNNIYFLNETGRPVLVQKRTILEVGSFPYSLDAKQVKYQNIPIEPVGPTILNVVVIPPKGPYGSADGVYYLFKPNDTLLIKLDKENRPLITHISSPTRSNELSFAQKHQDFVGIKPLYTFYGNNDKLELYKQIWSNDFKTRDEILDSLYWPYINTAENFCIRNSIDPDIGRWFSNFYWGNMISDKLFTEQKRDFSHQRRLVNFYKDSLIKWTTQFNCGDCGNIPSYNQGLKQAFKVRFNHLNTRDILDTIAISTKGNNRSFLLSSLTMENLEEDENWEGLLNHYNSLCKDSVYSQIVHNNYMLRKSSLRLEGNELAMLMRANKSQIGFNRLLSTLKGKVVYIDFWASWCKPCIEEIQFSHSLKAKLDNKRVAMLYISVDTDFGSWVQAREKYKLNDNNSFVLLNPEKNGLSKKINLGPIPRYIIVDKFGKIVRLEASRPSDDATYHTLMKMSDE